MPKLLIFVLGALLGANVGYMLMMPSRDQYKKLTTECIKSYSESIEQTQKCTASLTRSTEELTKCVGQVAQCVGTLEDCAQALGLLQGRSK